MIALMKIAVMIATVVVTMDVAVVATLAVVMVMDVDVVKEVIAVFSVRFAINMVMMQVFVIFAVPLQLLLEWLVDMA